MDATRFDTISKLFARRRTRRTAVASGVGLAATVLGSQALAQKWPPEVITPSVDLTDPHPSAGTATAKPEFLFVQPFDDGTWAPKDDADGVYTLTLNGAAANTVYFSDRPERIVGITPNQQFLDGLGFNPKNPPNAAVVAQRKGSEDQEILVIELTNPQYDGDAGTLTYDATVLADYGEPGLTHLAGQQQDYELGETFGSGGLFIDDCDTVAFACVNNETGENYGYGSVPFCWSADAYGCIPCSNPDNACLSEAFPDCRTSIESDGQPYYVNHCHAVSSF